MVEFVAFDLETTGTQPRSDKIIEFGAARFRNNQVVDTFESFVQPGCPIPPDATAVNGISNEMVAKAPDIKEVLPSFTEFCGKTMLVAHNASFDTKFLVHTVQTTYISGPTGVILDTHRLAKQLLPDQFSYSLERLLSHFGIEGEGFHRAKDDSIFCGQLFFELLKLLAEKNGGKLPPFKEVVRMSGGEVRIPKVEQPAQLGLLEALG